MTIFKIAFYSMFTNNFYPFRSDLNFIIEIVELYSKIVMLKGEFSPLEKWERKIIATIKWASENLAKLSLDKIEVGEILICSVLLLLLFNFFKFQVLALIVSLGKLFQSLQNYRNKFAAEIPTDERITYTNIDQHLFTICLTLSGKL